MSQRRGQSPFEGIDFEQLVEQMLGHEQEGKQQQKEKPKSVQWRAMMYQGDTLVLDHAQNDYLKVFRFVMNGLVELTNQNVTDYRVTIQDRDGNLRFFAVGPTTELVNYRKAGQK